MVHVASAFHFKFAECNSEVNLPQVSECDPDYLLPYLEIPDHSRHNQQESTTDRHEGPGQGHPTGIHDTNKDNNIKLWIDTEIN